MDKSVNMCLAVNLEHPFRDGEAVGAALMAEDRINWWFQMIEDGKISIHFQHFQDILHRLRLGNVIQKNGVILIGSDLAEENIIYEIWQDYWS